MKPKKVWHKPRPAGPAPSKKLSANQKKAAKAFAKKTGTVYPSLVTNMQGAKAKKGK